MFLRDDVKVETTAIVVAKDVGKHNKVCQGPYPGVRFKVTKRLSDIDYFVQFTEATLGNYKQLSGALFGLKKRFDNLAVQAAYDLESKLKNAQVDVYRKFEHGRKGEAAVMWRERNNQVELKLNGQLDYGNKDVVLTHNLHTDVSTLKLTARSRSWKLTTIAYKKPKASLYTAMITRREGDRGDFSLMAQTNEENCAALGLQWEKKPFKVTARAPVDRWQHPMLQFEVNSTREFGGGGGGPSMSGGRTTAPPGTLVHLEERRQGPLADRLRAIDRSHERQEAERQEHAAAAEGKRKKKFFLF